MTVSHIVLVCAAGAAFLSLCLSTVSLLIHYAKRGENPFTGPLEAEIQALRVGQAEIVDRFEHFMKRDRARRTRETAENEPTAAVSGPEIAPDQLLPKAQLRAIARNRGIIR